MPTDLIATTSELSLRPGQLHAADAPNAHDDRSENDASRLRIEVEIAIEIVTSDREVSLAGSIALRINRV
jgi:hypothetical protein